MRRKTLIVVMIIVSLVAAYFVMPASIYAEPENTVESIEYIPANPGKFKWIEGLNGWEYEPGDGRDPYFIYLYDSYSLFDRRTDKRDGDKIRIHYTDGSVSEIECLYKGANSTEYVWQNANGENIDPSTYPSFQDKQYDSPWTLGKNNYIEITYMGRTAQFPVEIIKNTIKDVKFVPKEPYEVLEWTNGYFDPDVSDPYSFFKYDGYLKAGDQMFVTKKDGDDELTIKYEYIIGFTPGYENHESGFLKVGGDPDNKDDWLEFGTFWSTQEKEIAPGTYENLFEATVYGIKVYRGITIREGTLQEVKDASKEYLQNYYDKHVKDNEEQSQTKKNVSRRLLEDRKEKIDKAANKREAAKLGMDGIGLLGPYGDSLPATSKEAGESMRAHERDLESAKRRAEEARKRFEEALNALQGSEGDSEEVIQAYNNAEREYLYLCEEIYICETRYITSKIIYEELFEDENATSAAAEVVDRINKLPNPDEIILGHKDQINGAKKAYDALSDRAKAKVPTEIKQKLEADLAKLAEIEADNNKPKPKQNTTIGTPTLTNIFAYSSKRENVGKWRTVKDATGYEFAWRQRGAVKWSSVKTGKTYYAKADKQKIKGLYEYKVRALKAETATHKAATGKYSNILYRYYSTVGKIKISGAKKGVKVSWAKDYGATSYQILYSTSNKYKDGYGATIVNVSSKENSKTVTGLKSGKTYYVQIRPIKKVGGINYIGNLSNPIAVKVK